MSVHIEDLMIRHMPAFALIECTVMGGRTGALPCPSLNEDPNKAVRFARRVSDLVAVVAGTPGLSLGDLANRMGRTPRTTQDFVTAALKAGRIDREKVGYGWRYYASEAGQ